MRAISTVFDVTVCLLLLSAAVVTLSLSSAGGDPPQDRTVDETASVLATTTVDLEYRLETERLGTALDATRLEARAAERPDWLDDRHRHGTLAGMIARAAIANTTVEGTPLAPETSGFRTAVRETVAPTLPPRTSVTARWRPYPDAPINGTILIGEKPPARADVQTATLTVPVGAVGSEASATESYRELADELAAEIVDATLVRTSGEFALGDTGITAAAVHRYRVLSGEQVTDRLLAAEIGQLNRAATAALADQLRADLRTRFETPAAAATATTQGTVWLTARRWSV